MEQERYELPDGWEWFPLQEFAYIKGGKRLPKGDVLLETETEYPYIRVSDFNEQGSIDISTVKYISSDTYQKIKRYTISNEDLYISIAGTIGKTGFLPFSIKKANLTENAAKIVFKQKNFAHLKYLYYFTLSNNFSHQIKNSTKTVAQPKLALSRLAQLQIPIPSYTEQRRIADKLDAVLGRIDDAIRLSQDNLASLDDLFASLLQQAFDPLGKASEETRYELPDEWEWKKLEDIATTTSGGTPSRSKKEYWNGNIPWIKSGELNDSFITTNSEFITDKGLHDSSCSLLPKGSLLIAMYGATAGRLGILTFDAAVNQAVCCIQNNSEISERDFIKYYLLSKRKQIIQDSFGGAQPNISQKYIRSFNIPCPKSLPEQRRIADKLDALSVKIALQKRAIEKKLDELNHLKSSVLDAAFRGRL